MGKIFDILKGLKHVQWMPVTSNPNIDNFWLLARCLLIFFFRRSLLGPQHHQSSWKAPVTRRFMGLELGKEAACIQCSACPSIWFPVCSTANLLWGCNQDMWSLGLWCQGNVQPRECRERYHAGPQDPCFLWNVSALGCSPPFHCYSAHRLTPPSLQHKDSDKGRGLQPSC